MLFEIIVCFKFFRDAPLSNTLFSSGHVCKDSSVAQSGAKSLTEFSAITKVQEKLNYLREQGLTDDEIRLFTKLQDGRMKEV